MEEISELQQMTDHDRETSSLDEPSASSDAVIRMVRDVFEVPDTIELDDDMGPEDVPGWDSLGGVNLLVEAEHRFGIKLSVEEAAEIVSVGDLRRAIAAARARK